MRNTSVYMTEPGRVRFGGGDSNWMTISLQKGSILGSVACAQYSNWKSEESASQIGGKIVVRSEVKLVYITLSGIPCCAHERKSSTGAQDPYMVRYLSIVAKHFIRCLAPDMRLGCAHSALSMKAQRLKHVWFRQQALGSSRGPI